MTRPVVRPDAVIPAWDDLTDDQRHRYAGNTDPWAGPVDPAAQARAEARHRADVTSPAALREHAHTDSCGCWRTDCAECGAKIADGRRPAPGVVRRYGLDRG